MAQYRWHRSGGVLSDNLNCTILPAIQFSTRGWSVTTPKYIEAIKRVPPKVRSCPSRLKYRHQRLYNLERIDALACAHTHVIVSSARFDEQFIKQIRCQNSIRDDQVRPGTPYGPSALTRSRVTVASMELPFAIFILLRPSLQTREGKIRHRLSRKLRHP